MLAADVEVPVGRRVLGHPGGAQENLVERRVRPLRQVEDLLLVHDERGGAEAGDDGLPALVELARHDHRVELGDARAGGGRRGLGPQRGEAAAEGGDEKEET